MKELTYERESKYLSEYAFLSKNTRGRQKPSEPCPYRTEFQRDRDRITHSKAFRRLMYKTQVFPHPQNDHCRTRLTHTIEVTQIARTIARALALNEDLTEAAAMGHDLGHAPFGHAGENALNDMCPGGFTHYAQSLRVADKLENLNLTYEVRDAIFNHTGDMKAQTLEGQILKVSDRIAYINHDIDDAYSAGILLETDVPSGLFQILGNTHSRRIGTMVSAVIAGGVENGLAMTEPVYSATVELRRFMFDYVYKSPLALRENKKIYDLISALYEHYSKNVRALPNEFYTLSQTDGESRAVCDYIACMTDRYAVNEFERLFIPRTWFEVNK